MRNVWMTCALLLAGCSFIDDWGGLSTEDDDEDAGSLSDAGMLRDAGTVEEDAGQNDAGNCPASCTGVTCPPDLACGDPDSDGCFLCEPCGACTGCGTQCALDTPGNFGTCYCEASVALGGGCMYEGECQPGLTCSGGVCVDDTFGGEGQLCRPGNTCDTGLECNVVENTCLRTCGTDADCTGVFPTCTGGFCRFPMGGEWEGCGTGGACDAGLSCRSIAGGAGGEACIRPCTASSQCTHPDYGFCLDADADGSLECAPQTGCDVVFDTGCPGTTVCRLFLILGTDVVGACLQPDDFIPIGGLCDLPNTCISRAECFMVGGGTTQCIEMCYVDDSPTTCSTGFCSELPDITHMGRRFGGCLAP